MEEVDGGPPTCNAALVDDGDCCDHRAEKRNGRGDDLRKVGCIRYH
jgi:hypothetical protein